MKFWQVICCGTALAGLGGCATPSSSAVSTIPWDERAQMDGLDQQYGLYEDDYAYNGMIEPEPLSYESF